MIVLLSTLTIAVSVNRIARSESMVIQWVDACRRFLHIDEQMPDLAIPQDPTNHDIMLILVQMNSKLDSVEKQAIKTNGRVNSIEEWKTGLQAVAAFQEKHPAQPQQINAPNATTVQVMQPNKWFQSEKLVGGVVVVLVALAALISFYAGGAQ